MYLRDTDIAFTDDRISHVNRPHQGEADTKIDGHDHIAMPGLINIHSHPSSERSRKGITDEIRSLGFFHSSLYEFLTIFNNAPEGFAANVRVAMGKLLLSGVTTVVDMSPPFDAWLGILAGSGIRACAAPGFRDAHWSSANSHQLSYEWDEANGRVGFERAQRVVDLANQHPSGRLMGMICPSQIDTSDIFGAATIGGARTLKRDDIARLSVGANADLVLVDLQAPSMRPVHEPLRSLIFVAGDRAIRDVFVEGARRS